MSANFDLAPPPKTVDGLLAVPIDIESIYAIFRRAAEQRDEFAAPHSITSSAMESSDGGT